MTARYDSGWQSTRPASAGILPAALACLFGLFGIFFIGLIFVPLAAVCALIGLIRGIGSGNMTAIGLSALAVVLCIYGFMVSPSLLLLFGLGALMTMLGTHDAASNIGAQSQPRVIYPVSQASTAPAFDPSDAQKLIARMGRFDSAVDAKLSEMGSIKMHYQSITERMKQLLQKEQALVGNDSASAMRSQISVAINQGSVANEQYHNDVMQLQMSLASQVVPLQQDVKAFRIKCAALPTAGIPAEWSNSCRTFMSAREEARKKDDALAAAFAEVEATYRAETRAQAYLVEQSDRIQ